MKNFNKRIKQIASSLIYQKPAPIKIEVKQLGLRTGMICFVRKAEQRKIRSY